MRRRGSKTIRRVHIGTEEWRYKIGQKFVQIWAPGAEHRTDAVEFPRLLGEEEAARRANERQTYLHDMWLENNYKGYPIFPSDVKKYIEEAYYAKA